MKFLSFQSKYIDKTNLKFFKISIYALLALISIFDFSFCILKQFPDIPDHNAFAFAVFHGHEVLPVHFLYFLILQIPQLFFKNIIAVHIFSVIILTLSVLYKYKISQRIFSNSLQDSVSADFLAKKSVLFFCLLIPFLVMISENIIWKFSATMFLGYIPLNTWHNSTTIFLMPFALLLFYQSYQYLLHPDSKKLWIILFLILLNLIIKPSFFMSFIIAFPLFCLLRFGLSKFFFLAAGITFIGALGLLVESKIGVYIGSTVISIKIAPFSVWAHWSDNIPLSFLSSLLFPLVFMIVYFKEVKNNLLLKYSIALFTVALLVYIIFTESGIRQFDANFAWQIIICYYILFLTTAIAFYKQCATKISLHIKDKILLLIFCAHIFTGIIYILKSPIFGFR
ncbi:MAG: hypothetical protein ABI199_01510 [Bacteroidia bacterium]